MYSSTLSNNLGANVRSGQIHALADLPHEREPVPIVQNVKWALGPVCTDVGNLSPTGIRSPDLPTSSVSLYRA